MGSFLSKMIKFFVCCMLLCFFIAALLPAIVSTEWGSKQLVYWINHSIPGKIEVDRIKLQWRKGQSIEGILLKDPEGKSILEIDKLTTEATLWQLLSKKIPTGLTEIQQLNAAIVTDDKGSTNLQRALGIRINSEIPPLVPSTIILSEINAKLSLFAKDTPPSVWMNGFTRQGSLNGSFEISLILNDAENLNWNQLKEKAPQYLTIEGGKSATLEARMVNFPVDLIDRLAALKNSHLNGFFHSMLGDRLNLTIDKRPSLNGLAFRLIASAPLMQGEVNGEISKGVLNVQQPSQFDFNLQPDSVNPFTHYHFELLKQSRLKLSIPLLTVPLNFFEKEGIVDPSTIAFRLEMSLPDTELDIPSIGRLTHNFYAYLDAPANEKRVILKGFSKAQNGKEPFEINFESYFNKPNHIDDLTQHFLHNMQMRVKISDLPLSLIPFFQLHPELSGQTGKKLAAQLLFKNLGINEWEAALSFKTSHLELEEAKFYIDKEILLLSPAKIRWEAPADFLITHLGHEWMLDNPFPLQILIKQLQIPLDNPKFTKYQIESAFSNLQFSTLFPWTQFNVQNALLKIHGQNLEQLNSKLEGEAAFLETKGPFSPFLKKSIRFTHSSFWKIDSEGTMEMANGSFHISNGIGQIQVNGRLDSNKKFEMTQPLRVQYALEPADFESLSLVTGKKWPKLKKAAQITFAIDPTDFNAAAFSFSSLKLQGSLNINHLYIEDQSETFSALEDLGFYWVYDAPQNNFYLNIKGSVFNDKSSKPIPLTAFLQFWPEVKNPSLQNIQAEFRLNCAGLPTSLVNVLLNTDDLSPILGPILDVNIKTLIDSKNSKPGYWDVLVDSSNFHLKGRFKLDQGAAIFDPDKLPNVRLTITPESYAYIKQLFALQNGRPLATPFTVACNLADLYLPFAESWGDQFKIDLQLSSTDLKWKDSPNIPLKFEGKAGTTDLRQQIDFSIQAHSASPIILKGTLKNVVDRKGRLQPIQEMNISLNLDGKQLTPRFVQNLLFLSQEETDKIEALLGDSFDLNSDCDFLNDQGALKIFLMGKDGQLRVEGRLKEGNFILDKPIEGSVKLTPRFCDQFLKNSIPLLGSAIGAENPLTLRIDPSSFSFPISPFKIENINIEKGSLNLGKVRFRNEGEIRTVLNAIRPVETPHLTIWFTPLYFQMKQGQLNFQRIDLLVAESYEVAAWGKYDLLEQKLKLSLGLNAQTLAHAFSLKGLDDQAFLEIPIESSNGKVSVDTKKTAVKIGALIGQSQGGKGKLIGDLLDLALSKIDEEPPSPTTQPFPWHLEFPKITPPQTSSTELTKEEAIEKKGIEKEVKKGKSGEKKKKGGLKNLEKTALDFLDQIVNP